MDIELKEIRDFIGAIPPFDRLPLALVEQITHDTTIRYLRRGATLPPDSVREHRLYIIRKGAVALKSNSGNLLGKLGDGDICTVFCLEEDQAKFSVEVEEDTLTYTISCDALLEIVRDYPHVSGFIRKTASQRLNEAVSSLMQQSMLTSSLIHTPVSELMHTPAITIEPDASIFQAARHMADRQVSSLIITEGTKPLGIITDKDIAQRCVAAGLSTNTPVRAIMTIDMTMIEQDTSAYDALLLMTRRHIHHLPIVERDTLSGIVTVTDLMREEGRNSAYLTSAIRKADSLESLVQYSRIIPQLQVQLVGMGATADHVGKGVTAITSAITRRLIEMAEEKLGPAPVSYAWIAAGSQARREQTSRSDQDNALIISDQMQAGDAEWFENFANSVCDGLNACGFVYCPGGIMASNPQWRQPVSTWLGYFRQWIERPEPEALLNSTVFFDVRTIYGDKTLLESIRADLLQRTPKNTLFLAMLSANAFKLRPPLGFFRDFVLIHDGEHNDTLDLKHNGIAPIVDLARIYALSQGIDAINTSKRLSEAAGTPALSRAGAANLQDALTFISTLRIRHQAEQIRNGETPDNFMPPSALSRLEREHLKDAFKVIQTMQNNLEMSQQLGRMG